MMREAIAWIGSLGKDLSKTRFGRYLAEIDRYAQDVGAGRYPDDPPLFYAAVADGQVLSLAYQQLRGRYDRYVARRVDRACKGSDTVAEENEANSDARNFCFELSLAGWLASSGLDVNCDDPADVGGEIAGHYLIVQCKRVRSERKVEMRGSKAIRRLRERLANPDRKNMVGAVAFDLTPLANPSGVPLRARNLDSRGLSAIGSEIVQRFTSAHGRHWHGWRDPDVVAVFNRVHLLGADIAVPHDATLQQFTFQSMHRLDVGTSRHAGFLSELNRLFAERGAALLSANQEARFNLP